VNVTATKQQQGKAQWGAKGGVVGCGGRCQVNVVSGATRRRAKPLNATLQIRS
jgi:hypothetical protein